MQIRECDPGCVAMQTARQPIRSGIGKSESGEVVQIGQVFPGRRQIHLQRPEVEGLQNAHLAVQPGLPRANGKGERVGPVQTDAEQRLTDDRQGERLPVGDAGASETCPGGAVARGLLVGGDSAREPQLSRPVRKVEMCASQAEVANDRQAGGTIAVGLAACSEVPVGPVRGIANQVDVGVLDFHHGQDNRAAQQRQERQLQPELPDARHVSLSDPTGVGDRDVVDHGVRMNRQQLQLYMAVDTDRSAQVSGKRTGNRPAQLVRPRIEDGAKDQDQQHERAAHDAGPSQGREGCRARHVVLTFRTARGSPIRAQRSVGKCRLR